MVRHLSRALLGRALAACALAAACLAVGFGGSANPILVAATAVPVPTGRLPLVAVTQNTVDLGTPVATNAILRQPASGDSRVGVVIAHPFSDYSSFQACNDLAARGFTTLCVNTMWTNHEYGYYGFEQHVPAIRAAVLYLRSLPAIRKVVLLGHSMGGPMMAFYQNVAEHGPSVCTGPEKIMPCVTTNLSGLPAPTG